MSFPLSYSPSAFNQGHPTPFKICSQEIIHWCTLKKNCQLTPEVFYSQAMCPSAENQILCQRWGFLVMESGHTQRGTKSERSQSQRVRYCRIPLRWRRLSVEVTEAESRRGCQGLGVMEGKRLMGTEFPFCKRREEFWGWMIVMFAQQRE